MIVVPIFIEFDLRQMRTFNEKERDRTAKMPKVWPTATAPISGHGSICKYFFKKWFQIRGEVI